MNPEDARSSDKQSMDRDLEQIRRAWEVLDSPEPPELVDRAVMNRAQRDLRKEVRPRMRWIGRFATAAVVVVALSLVLLQEQKPPSPSPQKADGLRLESSETMQESTTPPAAAPVEKRRIEELQNPATRQKAAPLPKSAAAEAFADESEAASASNRSAEVPRQPDAWIAELRKLRESGDRERFEQELAAFREAYPDYPLPPGW